MSNTPQYPHLRVLWIEEQTDEYYPIDEDLMGLFTLQIAETVDKGFQYLKEEQYNLILLDLMLPANDNEYMLYNVHLEAGQRILRALRLSEEAKSWATSSSCQVIVLTARGDKEALAEVRDLIGENGRLIQKPVDPDEFIQQVCMILLAEEE